MKKTALALSLLLASVPVYGSGTLPRLSSYEEGVTVGMTQGMYALGLLTLDEYAFTTGIEPYVCWPFPVEWEVFYGKIKYEVQKEVKQMSTKYRNSLGENFKYVVWSEILATYGCGDWGY